jgi:transcriptional regulator with XRE-family HTH domain
MRAMDTTHPLRRWRESTGTTLAALASKVGVTASHLSEIERGLNTASLNLAGRIGSATGGCVSANDLAGFGRVKRDKRSRAA